MCVDRGLESLLMRGSTRPPERARALDQRERLDARVTYDAPAPARRAMQELDHVVGGVDCGKPESAAPIGHHVDWEVMRGQRVACPATVASLQQPHRAGRSASAGNRPDVVARERED